MNVFKYLKDSYRQIVFFLLIILITDLVLISSVDLKKSLLDIFYLNILFFFVFLIFLAIDYTKWRNSYKDLKRALDAGENIDSFIPRGNRLEEILIRDIIELKNKEKLEETEKLKKNLEEINDYITKWVHEIKIPLSVCELIADKLEDEGQYDLSKELIQETERMNFLVNQVLHMSRASSYSQDFIVEEVNLSSLVKNVVKNNMNLFISKKIELEMGNLDFNIFTDKKWAYYVIEQIVNNACKYVDVHGKIKIQGEENDESVILTIWDNGMGIPEKDIDRIFDRGFTGENGRKTTKSTGMGLYICKKVADQLNFNIEVSSEVSKYTEFKIIFYKLSDYLKVTKM
ncbi:MAG TPA: sensor histidine kinase [Hungateiclostridium thermocellum]|uniref:histidine kinase n=1 Tax=Acetivibrio thermocellus (strain ATCC 27405 / DSM 1237 / JCM 9322 / NBRC 103400 / NCIMB 10682 / NRRL B-4536 / VPI 7372) TaxID=203119 RepID=A3DFM6_ACET2|nr:sensor histidine kinase [Acetivibrio thermocellus]ABN52755.1 integral membrane sensor signal transduction histidine kinase [Acetivibrio thermocellus ATCC 27405]HBW26360.1 sensor histidine kinase [Acetivibrio thermocellus]